MRHKLHSICGQCGLIDNHEPRCPNNPINTELYISVAEAVANLEIISSKVTATLFALRSARDKHQQKVQQK